MLKASVFDSAGKLTWPFGKKETPGAIVPGDGASIEANGTDAANQ